MNDRNWGFGLEGTRTTETGRCDVRGVSLVQFPSDPHARPFYDMELHGGTHKIVGGVVVSGAPDTVCGTVLDIAKVDARYMMTHGFLSLEFKQGMENVVGFPKTFRTFGANERLPDGRVLDVACIWGEFELLDNDKRADIIASAEQNTRALMLAAPAESAVIVATIYDEVMAERARQDAKWGGPAHDDEHNPDEWAEFIEDRTREFAKGFESLERQTTPERRRELLVEIAALAIAAVESHDRKFKLRE